MIPLWTIANCLFWLMNGWAFLSEGGPWVAQREWAMPIVPGREVDLRTSTRPFFLTREILLL